MRLNKGRKYKPTEMIWLFRKTLNYSHTLHALLPPQSTTSQHYHIRKRTHDRQLPAHRGHLSDRNFVTRVLYKHTY